MTYEELADELERLAYQVREHRVYLGLAAPVDSDDPIIDAIRELLGRL